ncbi:hypothetical protein GINT2_001110 [Glugoides intestinalis]
MKTIANQLNKVKNFSDSTSKNQSHDIDANVAAQFLEAIYNEENSFEGKHVVIFNTESGILNIGLSLFSPAAIVSLTSTLPNELFTNNMGIHNVQTDIIVSQKALFKEFIFDIAVIGPSLQKAQQSSLETIKTGKQISKKVYCLFKAEHKGLLIDKYKSCQALRSVQLKLPGSSNYHKQNADFSEYIIFKIE